MCHMTTDTAATGWAAPSVDGTLSRVVAFANGKGGAGKTSCAANVAGLAAAAGHRTLLIDMDPQGNAGHDLGYGWTDATDHGDHLLHTLLARGGAAFDPPVKAARANLDVIPGGQSLNELEDISAGRSRRGEDAYGQLANALLPIADNYDLVIIDTPPTRPVLLRMALAASRWIVIPTKPDRSSIEGLRVLATEIARVKPEHPRLAILGSVLFDVGTSSKVIRKNALEDIADVLGDVAPPFNTVIRHSERVATAARERGRLVYELAAETEDADPWWLALREGRAPIRVAGTAPALADDYVLLTQEILVRIAQNESAEGREV